MGASDLRFNRDVKTFDPRRGLAARQPDETGF
jgi:hypothetical protein